MIQGGWELSIRLHPPLTPLRITYPYYRGASSHTNPNSLGSPDHLQMGSQRDNKHDDWVHAAYGTDPDFL